MKHSEFIIGSVFECSGKVWRCTDVGTRVITAISVSDHGEDWLRGPPYAVSEKVFDEYDLAGCTPVERDASSPPLK